MAEERLRLGDFLVSRKIITEKQLNMALEHQKRWGGRLGEALIFLRIISEDKLLAALKYHLEIPIIDLDETEITQQVIKLVPKAMAEKYKAVPVRVTVSFGKKILLIAMSDPLDIKAIEELQFVTGYKVQPVLSKEHSLLGALKSYYRLETGYIAPSTDARSADDDGGGAEGEGDVMTIIRGGQELKIDSSGEVIYDEGEEIRPNPTDEDLGAEPPLMVPEAVAPEAVDMSIDYEESTPEKSKGDKKLLRALVKILIEKEYITVEDLKEKLKD